ncbi:MAG: CocE/NonD family hydrolase [Ruegeria sp.]
MTTQTEDLFQVDETDHLWIEMPDGVRLAARLWRPVTQNRVPAILEYIPYRKTDMVRARDERNHPYFAANGYASIRVDMRGSGDSEGHMPDMYAQIELDDARRVIEWLSAQPWCNGRVGMFGTSWGGTASLQASVRAPAQLKAVIAVCATHNRFEDDIHYMGGCVLSDTFEWGATLPSILASPPSANIGADWTSIWRERIESLSFPLENWLRECENGEYWRHGSVIHQADALSVPILAVGGWSDRYSNSVMTLVDARPDLAWGVVGPWGHHYPDQGSPGPAIGFQKLALDWWDHWLKPSPQTDLNWPRLRVWQREFDRPTDTLRERSGKWVETGPPMAETVDEVLPLASLLSNNQNAPWSIPGNPTVGQNAGDTGYFGRVGGMPLDQAADDTLSLVFETAPLLEDIVIYGAAALSLAGKSIGQGGQVIARLSEVDADGVAARISYGIRNLELDDDLKRGPHVGSSSAFSAEVRLHSTAYRVRKGNRIRLALSSSCWPMVHTCVPTEDILLETGTLTLPLMAAAAPDLESPFPPPQDLPKKKAHSIHAPQSLERWSRRDADAVEMGWHQPPVRTTFFKPGVVFGYETKMVHRLTMAGVVVQETQVDHQMTFDREDGVAEVSVTLNAKTSKGGTSVDADLNVTWNGKPFAKRHWRIP